MIQAFRQLGVAQRVDARVSGARQQRGLRPSHPVESLNAPWVSGGDRFQGLATAPQAAKVPWKMAAPEHRRRARRPEPEQESAGEQTEDSKVVGGEGEDRKRFREEFPADRRQP